MNIVGRTKQAFAVYSITFGKLGGGKNENVEYIVDAHDSGHCYIYIFRFPPSTSERDVAQVSTFRFPMRRCLTEIVLSESYMTGSLILVMAHIIKG